MDPYVLDQMGLLPESFVAIRAVERSLIRVSSLVLGKSCFLLKSSSTNLLIKLLKNMKYQ
jgi:hypothetical protein